MDEFIIQYIVKDVNKKEKKKGDFLQKVPVISRFFFNSIFAACANNHNRAFSLGHAQDGFALFALKINVRFAVAPLVAMKLKEINDRLFDLQIAVKLTSALIEFARKGAGERPNEHRRRVFWSVS